MSVIRDAVWPARPGDLSQMAVAWLREVVDAEFPGGGRNSWDAAFRLPELWDTAEWEPAQRNDPFDVAGRFTRGDIQEALWYRQWHRQWRRFQLPDQLLAFYDELGRARTAPEVYDALSKYSASIVGAYTALVFPPRKRAGKLRPVPNPRLSAPANQLSVPVAAPLPKSEPLLADGARSGPLAGLAPLFEEERAFSLAHAPLGSGGLVLLVERRRERVFEAEDWELLRTLCAHADAAIRRISGVQSTDSDAAGGGMQGFVRRAQAADLLRHVWQGARRGVALSVVAVRTAGLSAGEAKELADGLRRQIRPYGIGLTDGPGRLLLVLPRYSDAQAARLVERLNRLASPLGVVSFAMAAYQARMSSADQLLDAAIAALNQIFPEQAQS